MKIEQLKREHEKSMTDLRQNMDGKFHEVDIQSQSFQSKLEHFENYMTSIGNKIEMVKKEARFVIFTLDFNKY